MNPVKKETFKEKMAQYKNAPFSFVLMVLVMLCAAITAVTLIFIVIYILVKGVPHLTPSLFSPKYNTENVSMLPAIINTFIMTFISLLIAVPLGIFSAVYLVEYAKRGNKIVGIIRMTTETLQGIPSIVYGLFGYLFFVSTLKLRYTILSGALTLSIMILPLVMRTTEEALKSVPDSYREGSFGLGAGKLRTVFKIVIPSAIPGILSGVILATGRIAGETAALIFTAGTGTEIAWKFWKNSGRTLAVHMYNLSSEGLYVDQCYATAVVLLVMVALINGLSGLVAKKLSKG
ncbi:phosphate ABC transporter permease PstA [Porcipelethomonas sp.]|uniref:phosphate ABC transporter permease PstA n=1 Tax=Porcipelethomonas sp. TaxID=2981675 RepID=UPI003EFA397B